MTAAEQGIGLYPRAPRWRGLIARMATQLAGMATTLRVDVVTRPCAWCPPPPPPGPVTRPCVLCWRESHRSVQSPDGVTVNEEPVCAAHYREVARLRGLMQSPEAWNRHLETEQAEAGRQETTIARAYHRRRALRSMERASA